MEKYVAYYRVSTRKQGDSGLGLEAQEKTVAEYLAGRKDAKLLHSFCEVQSGTKNDRIELNNAIRLCEVTGARLLVAKLDRLSRNVAFLANLQESKVAFTCCDMPDANEFTIHIFAALAQQERELISIRTKAALQAAKSRGVKLGGYRENAFNGKAGEGWRVLPEKANERAKKVASFIREAQEQGCTSLRKIAQYLNEKEIPTPRGKAWEAASVQRTLKRMAELEI